MKTPLITQINLHDTNGKLLLAEGCLLTPQKIKLLSQHGFSVEDTQLKNNDIESIADKVNSTIVSFKQQIKDTHFHPHYEKAGKILSQVIFHSKNEAWWLFPSTLANYVDWLYTHSVDVALISLIIGQLKGYDDNKLGDLATGSFLHDAGKLLIPKSIVVKSTPLTESEAIIIRQHCELGMLSLSNCVSQTCLDIIAHHHERLDGSGYPFGLTKDQIRPEVQIVMIADAISKITSFRPYQPLTPLPEGILALESEPDKYPPDILLIAKQIFNPDYS